MCRQALKAPVRADLLQFGLEATSAGGCEVGQIMDALDGLGIADTALLVSMSEHGPSVCQHGFWGNGGATFLSNLHHAAQSAIAFS